MPKIAVSGWMAYAPFRVASEALESESVSVISGAHDRVEGLSSGRYDAALLSTYEYIESILALSEHRATWAFVEPVGYGSDRIVARSGIETVADLHGSKIGLRRKGLELNLFEHLFRISGLPRKTDYVFLKNRSEYVPAFVGKQVDVVMAPQPYRSRLLRAEPTAQIFEGDERIPRHGLYAIMVAKPHCWSRELMERSRCLVSEAAVALSAMCGEQLVQADPQSFEGIDDPAQELSSTVRWLNAHESREYLAGSCNRSFHSHVADIVAFRNSRFDPPTSVPPLTELIEAAMI
jgi:hypothetical protein